MKKTEKSIFVDNLIEELKTANSVILVDYSGLDVQAQQELKKRLAEVDSKLMVVKNTLFRIAGEKAELPEDTLKDTVLSGQTALILSEKDPISPLSVLAKFSKEFETPQFKVGIIEGSFQDKEKLDRLSKLPGKEALFAQTVGVIASPTYALVGTLEANLQNLVFVLNKAKSQKGGDK